jgi:Uma2 family endonuclease
MSESARAKTKLTYSDYVLLPDDGKVHEIIDGDHYMSPAPGTDHQTVSRWIQFQLFEQIEKEGTGRVFNAPTDVQLTESDIVQPDIAVVAYARREIITRSRILGVPDLVVEVISPSRVDHDRQLKLRLYQGIGVPEYWLVDTEARALDRYRLEGDVYNRSERFTGEVPFSSGDMSARVNLTEVWRAVEGM